MVNVIVLIIETYLTTKPRRKEGLEMSRKLRKLRLIAFDEDFVTCSHVITFASAWPFIVCSGTFGESNKECSFFMKTSDVLLPGKSYEQSVWWMVL